MALNMLIAILSDTYSRLAENRHAEWCLLFGGIVSQSQVLDQWPHNLKLPAPLSLVTHLLYPLVWLQENKGWAWPAITATTAIFIIDEIVHLLVGFPVILVNMIPFIPVSLKMSGEGAVRYIIFPFVHLYLCLKVFLRKVPIMSFDKYKSFMPVEKKPESNFVKGPATSNSMVNNDGAEENGTDLQEEPGTDAERGAEKVPKSKWQDKSFIIVEKPESIFVDGPATSNPMVNNDCAEENGADLKEEPEWLTAMRQALEQCQITEDATASAQVLSQIANLENRLEIKMAKLEAKLETKPETKLEEAVDDLKGMMENMMSLLERLGNASNEVI